MNRRSFFKNAVLLTATGLVLRAAGLLLRVLLACDRSELSVSKYYIGRGFTKLLMG